MTSPNPAPPCLALSIVVPVHNEAGNIAPLIREIRDVMHDLGRSYEILYVNDGSYDGTLPELIAMQSEVPALRVIDLDDNFGEAAALCAGFAATRGDLVVTLDGDGQNDPADIPSLIALLEGHRLRAVSGWRVNRQEDALTRALPSRVANALLRWVTGVPLHDNGCGLKAYRHELVREPSRPVALPPGFHRFLPAILGVTAAEVAEVGVNDRRRRHGRSHYGLRRVVVVARDLLAVSFLLRAPLFYARMTSAVIGALLMHLAWYGPTAANTIGLLADGSLVWNLRRFLRAQRSGVYRVRREHPALGAGA